MRFISLALRKHFLMIEKWNAEYSNCPYPGSIDALANAWPMLGMPTYIRNIGKPTLGETKLLDTFSNVTMFNIVPILSQQCPNVAEKTDINQFVKFFF